MIDNFKFLEKFEDMAAVSDAASLEIVYMNHQMMAHLGFTSHNDYAGKKYYEVIYASKGPFISQGRSTIYSCYGMQYMIEFFKPMTDTYRSAKSVITPASGDVLNTCLHYCIETLEPDVAIYKILAHLCKIMNADRASIFETTEDGLANNTYEWCNTDVPSQKSALQKIPLTDIDIFFRSSHQPRENTRLVISDTEELRTSYPITYSLLRPQNIRSMIADAIYSDGKLKGFFALENPSPPQLYLAAPITGIIGYLFAEQIKRRQSYQDFQRMSYRDFLTGAFNRNALFQNHHFERIKKSVGLLYADISGLRIINEALGHLAGDRIICNTYQFLQANLDTKLIYRVGGDEFIAAFVGKSEDEFDQIKSHLAQKVSKFETHLTLGSIWTDQMPINLEHLLSEVDDSMYKAKQSYYAQRWNNLDDPGFTGPMDGHSASRTVSPLDKFAKTTYTDVTSFFHSISTNNSTSYFFLGDMQQDLFYISDNMRDEFGFHSNIINGLLKLWENKISNPVHRKQYTERLSDIIAHRSDVIDLRHQVINAKGKIMWVHGYGKIKWSEDNMTPLFFSGRITHQDNSFVVDPLTNYPTEPVALRRLEEITDFSVSNQIVGFSLNSIAEINSTRGRAFGDNLIRHLAQTLESYFFGEISFFRLDGMRFMGIVDPSLSTECSALADRIEGYVSDVYKLYGLTLNSPCSFAFLDYSKYRSPSKLLSSLVPLIDVAENTHNQRYLDDSTINFNRIKQMSDIFLSLGRDVFNDMQNFRVMVQPIVSTTTGDIIAGETLLRWSFQGKDISPAVFIPRLEKDQTISIVGRCVFEQAVSIARRLSAMNHNFYLTVNVSLEQLNDVDFPDFVRNTLKRYQLNGKHIVVELTESCLDKEPDRLIRFVDTCRACGVRVALDDFGSGYSSMRVLLQYPSSIIKLDRSLLIEIMDSRQKMQFIRSMVYACHQFGKKVCMEGVETEEQDKLAKECGCDMIQGFYYHRPLETNAIYSLFSNTFI